jgi:hypothetical protein
MTPRDELKAIRAELDACTARHDAAGFPDEQSAYDAIARIIQRASGLAGRWVDTRPREGDPEPLDPEEAAVAADASLLVEQGYEAWDRWRGRVAP